MRSNLRTNLLALHQLISFTGSRYLGSQLYTNLLNHTAAVSSYWPYIELVLPKSKFSIDRSVLPRTKNIAAAFCDSVQGSQVPNSEFLSKVRILCVNSTWIRGKTKLRFVRGGENLFGVYELSVSTSSI